MPELAATDCRHNPFTNMVNAVRALFVGTPAGNQIWLAVVWSVAITLVFGSLAVWRYRHAVGR